MNISNGNVVLVKGLGILRRFIYLIVNFELNIYVNLFGIFMM